MAHRGMRHDMRKSHLFLMMKTSLCCRSFTSGRKDGRKHGLIMAPPGTHACTISSSSTRRFAERGCMSRYRKGPRRHRRQTLLHRRRSSKVVVVSIRTCPLQKKSKAELGGTSERRPSERPWCQSMSFQALSSDFVNNAMLWDSQLLLLSCGGVKQIETPTTSSTPLSSYRLIVLMQLSSSSLPASYVSSSPSHFTAQVSVCFANGRSINSDLESSATVYRL